MLRLRKSIRCATSRSSCVLNYLYECSTLRIDCVCSKWVMSKHEKLFVVFRMGNFIWCATSRFSCMK